MHLEPSQFRYSITVEPEDEAVLFCLRALWQYAEREPADGLSLAPAGAWERDNERITFRFSTPYNRADFLGEATRLLAGKWTRLAASDDDPPAS